MEPWSATGLGLEPGQHLESLQKENTPRLVPTTGSSSKIAQSIYYNHKIQYAKNEKKNNCSGKIKSLITRKYVKILTWINSSFKSNKENKEMNSVLYKNIVVMDN